MEHVIDAEQSVDESSGIEPRTLTDEHQNSTPALCIRHI
jgi:hypothetical protein